MSIATEMVDKWCAATLNGDTDALNDLAHPAGRARGKRSRHEAPAVTAPAAAAPTGFVRPNGETYVSRKLAGFNDVELCRTSRSNGLPALLYGAPGTGKTALLEAAFWTEPGGLFTVSGSADTERADFVGGYVQAPDGKFRWVDGPLIEAMVSGGVLFIDEIALIDPKTLSVVYSVMDGRGDLVVTENPERGTIKAAEGFYVAGACNPNVPGARMSEALVSRFTVQAEYGSDYDLAKKLGAPARFVNAAKNLEAKRLSGEVSWAPQMRECLAFAKVHKIFGETLALRNLVAVSPEIDRDQVASVLGSAYGVAVEALKAE